MTVTDSVLEATGNVSMTRSRGVTGIGTLVMDRCLVTAQAGTEDAWGAEIRGDATISNSVFIAGDAPFDSIGVHIWPNGGTGTITLANVYARGGDASVRSSGVFIWQGGDLELVNSVVEYTPGASTVDGVYVGENSSAALHNVLFAQDTCAGGFGGFPGQARLCLYGTELAGCGAWPYGCDDSADHLVGAPLFVDKDADWAVSSGSPAIDNGIDPESFVGAEAAGVDLHGDPRPLGSGWDIGPVESE